MKWKSLLLTAFLCLSAGLKAQKPDSLSGKGIYPVRKTGLDKPNFNEFSLNLFPILGMSLHSSVRPGIDLGYRFVFMRKWALRSTFWYSDAERGKSYLRNQPQYFWVEEVFDPDSNAFIPHQFYANPEGLGGRLGLERVFTKPAGSGNGRLEGFVAIEVLVSRFSIRAGESPIGGMDWYQYETQNHSDLGLGLTLGGRALINRHWSIFIQGSLDVFNRISTLDRTRVVYTWNANHTQITGVNILDFGSGTTSRWMTSSFPFLNSAGIAFRF